jgi:hypothetical protein
MDKLYVEKQKGGLCRKHALNAYFRKSKYSEEDFHNLCSKYDLFMKECGYITNTSSKHFDLIESNQFTVISYALFLEKVYSILVPYSYLGKMLDLKSKKSLSDLIDSECNFIFVFNENHIWGCGKQDGKWYNIDSMSGIKQININAYDLKKHGFIIPCSHKRTIQELVINVSDIKSYIERKNINFNNCDELELLLSVLHNKQLILDDLEILIASVVNILRIITDYSNNTDINMIITTYKTFVELFEKEKSNFNHIKNYIPDILKGICNLNLNAFKIN